MYKKGIYKILANEPLTATVWRMVLGGDTQWITAPGQFVDIALEGRYLRRPISVCDYDATTLTLIYKVVGEGTAQMSRMAAGGELDLLTGLGNGFDVHNAAQRPLLVGGGVGVPPLYNLAKVLLAAGKRVGVVLGFNTADEVFYADEFRALGCDVDLATADGSAGVRGFVTTAIAECRPEDKIKVIKEEQAQGKIVAMTGDGTNDAPALAQADVGLAMNSGTTAAKEAANMVDLDSDPTKILEVVEIGKQLLITRGSLTTFSIANDIAKYFAIIPAMFMMVIPQMQVLNIMKLASPTSAILSALIFNAIIIPCLIPLAMRGVKYKPMSASKMLTRNMLIYGLGGVIVPFIGIKVIDLIIAPLLTMLGLGMAM